jgi:hypothetical protein
LERCLLEPLHELCTLPGPILLDAIHRIGRPTEAASLLHRVVLFAEPRLTAPTLEDLFTRLARHQVCERP